MYSIFIRDKNLDSFWRFFGVDVQIGIMLPLLSHWVPVMVNIVIELIT